jgi:DNA-binding NtrC family response regulator
MGKRTYRVLLVDDSRVMLAKLEEAFAATAYQIRAVTNPLEAYRLVEDDHFDIVVTDIEMPEMSGLDLLRKIKNHNGMIQVIVVTGAISVNNVLNAFRYGASDLVFKPFEKGRILDAVDAAAMRFDHVGELIEHALRIKGR